MIYPAPRIAWCGLTCACWRRNVKSVSSSTYVLHSGASNLLPEEVEQYENNDSHRGQRSTQCNPYCSFHERHIRSRLFKHVMHLQFPGNFTLALFRKLLLI